MSAIRVALIHDWLLGMRGGERCLEVLCSMFPDAEIYTLFYDARGVSSCINERPVTASPLNRLPGVKRYYRGLLPLYPLAAAALGRSLARRHAERPYDLVISVSHCAAKNVPTPAGVPHLCYCLTPVRYLWDQYQSYFAGRWYEPLVRMVAAPLRRWDVRAGAQVTRYIGISRYVSERIKRYYGRAAGVVYPPVRSDWIQPAAANSVGEGYLCVSALVPYKNVDLIIRAFTDPRSLAAGRTLTVVGSGPEGAKLRELAAGCSAIRFLERLTDAELAKLYRESAALVFAAEEDFGMVPVEMQAAGRPVICYRRGGALETVRERETGIFFDEMSVDSLLEAVAAFDSRKPEFKVDNCLRNARSFSLLRFVSAFDDELEQLARQVGRPLGAGRPPAAVAGVGNYLETK